MVSGSSAAVMRWIGHAFTYFDPTPSVVRSGGACRADGADADFPADGYRLVA